MKVLGWPTVQTRSCSMDLKVLTNKLQFLMCLLPTPHRWPSTTVRRAWGCGRRSASTPRAPYPTAAASWRLSMVGSVSYCNFVCICAVCVWVCVGVVAWLALLMCVCAWVLPGAHDLLDVEGAWSIGCAPQHVLLWVKSLLAAMAAVSVTDSDYINCPPAINAHVEAFWYPGAFIQRTHIYHIVKNKWWQ